MQPIAFAILIAAVPMPEPPAWTRIVSPGSSLALSNSMCCTVPKAIGAQAASSNRNAVRRRNDEPGRHVETLAREAVDVEAHHPADGFAQVVAALAAGARHWPQVCAPYIADLLAGREFLDALAHGPPRPRRLRADDERQLALGESHAAKAPDVDMVEADRAHPDLNLARRGRRGRVDVGKAQVAVAEELKGAHEGLLMKDVA